MVALSFIHVADLHLDTAFSAISHLGKEKLSERLCDAPFDALENLLKLCKEKQPNFVILSGDVYNNEEGSLKARFALNDAFERLKELDITVYYAHGNHDPYIAPSKQNNQNIECPENVHVFSGKWEYFSHMGQNAMGDEIELARIYGISHTTSNEKRNLTQMLDARKADCVQIGVLHTGIVSSGRSSLEMKESYAPCSVKDLQKHPMNYWALGHIHIPTVLDKNPPIIYSGSMQGLHINEDGQRGCMYVKFANIEKGHVSDATYIFHTLGPVQWHIVDVELEAKQSENTDILLVQKKIAQEIKNYMTTLSLGKECTDIIIRIRLFGRSGVAALLHEHDVQMDMCNALQNLNHAPKIYIKDIQSFVRPAFDFERALQRDDILGEALRVTLALRENPNELELFEKEAVEMLKTKISRFTTHLHNGEKIPDFDEEKHRERLSYLAEEICVEVLEPK